MNGWDIAALIGGTIIALGFLAWGVSVAWAVSGYRHVLRGELEPDDDESDTN